MPRRKPIPTARRQFAQRLGLPSAMPASAMAQMQSRPGQMARHSRAQTRNPLAGRAKARQNARGARRQLSLSDEFSSIMERAAARPAGLKAEWQQSIWFQIPGLGEFVDLLRSLVYPQENLRVMKRDFVGTGIGSIAKNRAMARFEQRRQEKLASRQQALVQRNRASMARNTIAGQQARKRTRGTKIFPRQKAA